MKTAKILLGTILVTALTAGPVLADKDEGYDKKHHKGHYKEMHQMKMDMMQMLSETMAIVRNLEHRPSEAEKARLDEMINQLDGIMASHKDMAKQMGERYKKHHKNGKWEDDGHHNMMN